MKIELDGEELEAIIKNHILKTINLAEGQGIVSIHIGSYGANTKVEIGTVAVAEPECDVPFEMPAHNNPDPTPVMLQPKAPSGDEVF